MIARVNILIDGGFFMQKFREQHRKFPNADDTVAEVERIMEAVRKKSGDDCKDVLMRVYYYDCKPYGGKEKNPNDEEIDFSTTKFYQAREKALRALAQKERFAVRLGELSFDGWDTVVKKTGGENTEYEYVPKLKQKGVDMKVGLDMALMALKRTADKVVLVAGDSDFIAPMKFVRKEGMQVYLYSMGHRVKSQLTEHCDFKLS